jgi:hypothetical protein
MTFAKAAHTDGVEIEAHRKFKDKKEGDLA